MAAEVKLPPTLNPIDLLAPGLAAHAAQIAAAKQAGDEVQAAKREQPAPIIPKP